MSRIVRRRLAVIVGILALELGVVAGGVSNSLASGRSHASPPKSAEVLPAPPFDSSLLRKLDLQKAAHEQYGRLARLTGERGYLYGLRVRVGNALHSLDVARAVRTQFGAGWIVGAIGPTARDWRAFHMSALRHQTIVIMLVAADQLTNVSGIRRGLSRYASVLDVVYVWYKLRAGVAPRFTAPLIVPTDLDSSGWARLSTISTEDAHRYDLLHGEIRAMTAWIPGPNSRYRAVVAPYVGDRPDLWLGAADGGPVAVAVPRETSVACDPSRSLSEECSDAAYAIGHELGHAYGLAHSCDTYPRYANCGDSIMQTGKPMGAILLPPEVSKLRASPFLG